MMRTTIKIEVIPVLVDLRTMWDEVAPPIYKILEELLLFSKPAGVNCLCHPLMSGFTLKLLYNILLSPRGSF